MPRPPAAALVIVALVAALALGGCGTADDEALAPKANGGIEIAETVALDGSRFDPDEVTVEQGASVEWTNEDDRAHTVTADDELFDSGAVEPGESFLFTFETPGTYVYGCSLHPGGMGGRVTVTR